jgi:RNA polymerase sigma-70 factor (ECF subfamily)
MGEDKLLIWRFKHDSKDAFRAIYEKYADDLLSLAANLLNDPSGAEDVVQDVFISFAKSVKNLRSTENLKSYLTTSIVNRVRDYYRKAKRQRTTGLEKAEQVSSNVKSPLQLVENSEQMLKLNHAIAELPHEQREAVILRLHGDMRFRQIAELQNVSTKTALSRYRYGLDKLRSTLKSEVSK